MLPKELSKNWYQTTPNSYEWLVTIEIALAHSEVKGAEALARKYSGAVGQTAENFLQMLVDLGPEGQVVDEDERRREDVGAVDGVEKVALEEPELGVGLAVKAHPELEVLYHILKITKQKEWKQLK